MPLAMMGRVRHKRSGSGRAGACGVGAGARPSPKPPSIGPEPLRIGGTGMDANKAVAAGMAGGIATILAWVLHQWGGVEMPAEVAAAVTTVISTGAAYLVPHSS